jgi:hypothetical protein
MKIGLCVLDENDNLIKSKTLSVKFREEVKDEMKSFFSLDMKTEIANILLQEIKKNLTIDDIKELLEDI